MAKKSTKAEIINRVKIIIDFLLDGLSRYEILQYGSKKWDITGRQVDEYIAWANKRITRMAEKAEEKSYDRIRNRLERQYRRAVQNKDGSLARLLIKDIRELYAFDKPRKAEVDESGKPVTPEFNLILNTGKQIEPTRRRKILELLDETNGEDRI